MSPKVKQLLLLARKLAPIPGFLAAFGTWGFVFKRYSDPPIDMAGRALAAALASASAAKEAQARSVKASDEEEKSLHAFTPYDGCLQQKALFPQHYGALVCAQDELSSAFPWAWAPTGSRLGSKATSARPKSSAAEPRKRPKTGDGENDGSGDPAPPGDPGD